VNYQALFDASPNPYLVLDRRLHIVAANRAYLASVQRDLSDILGRWAWDVFPADKETVRKSVASFERVIRTGQPDTMALLRFEVARPQAEGGGFVERYWSITHSPVLDEHGEVEAVLQHPIDVTELRHLQGAVERSGLGSALNITPEQSGIFGRAQSVYEANLALKAESDRLSEMFSQAPSFMAVLRGRQHRFELANPSYMDLVGHRPIIGQTFAEALPDTVGQGYLGLLDRVFASGEPHAAHGAHIAIKAGPDEAPRDHYLDFILQPLKDASGQVTGIFIEGSDVTERVAGEAALRASQERLSALVSASSEVLYSMSADWGEMRQLSGGGFLADTRTANPNWLTEYIPEDEQPRVRAAISDAIRNKALFDLEHQVRRADGGVGWTLSRAVPLLGPDGSITEWFGTASDVTARREAEEALRQLNDTLEQQVVERTAERDQMWETSPDLLLIIDFNGVFRRVNPTWTTLLGYAPEELVGHHVNEFVLPDDHHQTTGAYELAGRGGQPQIENRYRHKDGSTRWISWVAAPGEGVTYATGRDITAEKEREAELAKAQEALRQSQKMEAVGQLTGGLAHDFNNLLTGVTGSLELLQTRVSQGRIKDIDRYVNAAQGAARRAASLTHRLLAFARRQTLDPKPTDVNRLVAGMEELIRRTVGPQITVEPLAGAVGLWSTLVDPGQLENALLNLCINARDAMPDGGKITIETANRWMDERAGRERDLPPGQYVSLCVSDTGTGMSPDVQAKAFDPFFTTKPIGQGTGLGLSMIYGFARQSGGQVRIYSEEGQGTTLCIYLPRHLGQEEVVEAAPDLADAPRAEQGETVLVVDDEPTVRMLVTEVLEDLGYAAVEAADGASGLRVLHSDVRLDLLVTDVGLPGGMNGRQVADAARVARPDLKVLFITGYAENAVLSHGHLEPDMHVLTKPFTMEALASRIRKLIAS
jgi:PAS domain S-box-containing protein